MNILAYLGLVEEEPAERRLREREQEAPTEKKPMRRPFSKVKVPRPLADAVVSVNVVPPTHRSQLHDAQPMFQKRDLGLRSKNARQVQAIKPDQSTGDTIVPRSWENQPTPSDWKTVLVPSKRKRAVDERRMLALTTSIKLAGQPANKVHKPLQFLVQSGEFKLACSLFRQSTIVGHQKKVCTVYCHGLATDKLDGIGLLPVVSNDSDLLIFDFSGCGESDGRCSTFGLRESQDLSRVLTVLSQEFEYEHFWLWGTNTGCAAIIRCVSQYPELSTKILGVVLDGLFPSNKSFIKRLLALDTEETFLGGISSSIEIYNISNYISEATNYNILDSDNQELLDKFNIPTVLLCPKTGNLFPYDETFQMLKSLQTKWKTLIYCEDSRPGARREHLALLEAYTSIQSLSNWTGGTKSQTAGYNLHTQADWLTTSNCESRSNSLYDPYHRHRRGNNSARIVQ